MKNISVLFILSLFIVSCGGGGDNQEISTEIEKTSTIRSLSKEPALKDLYLSIQQEQEKGEFEKSTEYDTRIDVFTESLANYVVSVKILTRYDADAEELYIYTLPYDFSEGENKASTVLYTGYTKINFQNITDLYNPVTREEQNAFTGDYFTRNYYKIISISPNEAEKIIDGFMVDYELSFNVDQVLESNNHCISANFTQCINYVYANVVTYKVYNTVNNQEYY